MRAMTRAVLMEVFGAGAEAEARILTAALVALHMIGTATASATAWTVEATTTAVEDVRQ